MDYFDILARMPKAAYDAAVPADVRKKLEYMFGGVDIFGFRPFQAGEQYRYMDDYLRQRGLSWSDVKYPSLARGAGSMSGLFNGSARAISRLYDDRSYRSGQKSGYLYGYYNGFRYGSRGRV